jgi:hypothetical protein
LEEFREKIECIDSKISNILKSHVSAVLYGVIKNSTQISFYETKKICKLIDKKFLARGYFSQINLSFQLIQKMIQLSPTIAALLLFSAQNILRIFKN